MQAIIAGYALSSSRNSGTFQLLWVEDDWVNVTRSAQMERS